MIFQEILARVSVTATIGGALIPLPQNIGNGDIIMLAVVGGYNADLEFATAATIAPVMARHTPRTPAPLDRVLISATLMPALPLTATRLTRLSEIGGGLE